MRVFSIGTDDSFTEYETKQFDAEHEEVVLQKWLEANPDGILEEGRLLIIGREVQTDLGGFIDLLGLDRQGNVVVVELKRDRTPRDTIAQALEYASYAERLDADALERILRAYEQDDSLSLADQHRKCFALDEVEAVAFNKDQRLVIVGQTVTPQVRQTAAFLGAKGIRTSCVEFTLFQADGGRRLLSQEIVVGESSAKPSPVSSSRPIVTERGFLESCDEHGRAVYPHILDWAKRNDLPISWGTRGFSVGVDVSGARVVVCYAYPPAAVYKQTLYTNFHHGSGFPKTAVPSSELDSLREQADATSLFVAAGRELKCHINRSFSDAETASLMGWLEAARQAIVKYGPGTRA